MTNVFTHCLCNTDLVLICSVSRYIVALLFSRLKFGRKIFKSKKKNKKNKRKPVFLSKDILAKDIL